MCIFSFLRKTFKRRPMNNTFRLMTAHVEQNSEFNSLNGKNILWFPLQVPHNVLMYKFLEDTFNKYLMLVKREEFKISEDNVKIVRGVMDGLLNVLKIHQTGDVIKAYESFETLMKYFYDSDSKLPSIKLEDGYTFYRMRAKEHNLKDKREFYHLPINKRSLCSSGRFSIAGYPCLYLGYSKNVCMVETSQNGTMCGLELSKAQTKGLKILDLSFGNSQNEDEDVDNFIIAWPLIVSCYIIMANEQINRDSKFREEYIIPQMLTAYLRHNTDFDGIRYYSTRNENLNPYGRKEEDFRNVVLFTKNYDSDGYDMELINRFKWFEPFNIGTIKQ